MGCWVRGGWGVHSSFYRDTMELSDVNHTFKMLYMVKETQEKNNKAI